jgi:hypothetical protein
MRERGEGRRHRVEGIRNWELGKANENLIG